MFKKTLVAASMLVTFGASAATVYPLASTDGVINADELRSVEGFNTLVAAAKELTSIAGTAAGDLSTATEFPLRIANASAMNAGDYFILTVSGADKLAGTPTVAASTGALSFVDVSGDDVRFLVTTTVPAGETLDIVGLKVTVNAPADGDAVTVSSKAVNGILGEFDAGKAAPVIAFADQYDFAVKANGELDGVINVEDSRITFSTADGHAARADVLDTQFTKTGAVLNAVLDAGDKFKYVITGEDFSYMKDFADKDGKIDLSAAVSLAAKAAPTYALSEDFTTLTITDTAQVGAITLNLLAKDEDKGVMPTALNAQEFSVAGSVIVGTTEFSVASKDAGEWGLNGAIAEVPFMPYGSQYSQSVTVANTSTLAGAIEVVWYVDGQTITTPLSTVAKAKSVTNISGELRDLAIANGIDGNVAFDVIVNAPKNDVEVIALYFSNGDRLRTK